MWTATLSPMQYGCINMVKKGRTKDKGNKICKAGKDWAMRTYGKWSAYAAMGASKYCKDPNYAKKKK